MTIKKFHGLSVPELLVGLTVGGMVMLMGVQLLSSSKGSSNTMTATTEASNQIFMLAQAIKRVGRTAQSCTKVALTVGGVSTPSLECTTNAGKVVRFALQASTGRNVFVYEEKTGATWNTVQSFSEINSWDLCTGAELAAGPCPATEQLLPRWPPPAPFSLPTSLQAATPRFFRFRLKGTAVRVTGKSTATEIPSVQGAVYVRYPSEDPDLTFFQKG